jgi:hypothetical protein
MFRLATMLAIRSWGWRIITTSESEKTVQPQLKPSLTRARLDPGSQTPIVVLWRRAPGIAEKIGSAVADKSWKRRNNSR